MSCLIADSDPLIADSDPLIALAELGLLDLPARLFGRVAMPATVFAECQAQAWLTDAKAIQAAVDAGHLEVLADIAWPADLHFGCKASRIDRCRIWRP